MANNLKQLDANQVLRSTYDATNNRLRVDAQISAQIGQLEVIINHTEDSVRLGDGTDLTTTTTVGSDVGLDINLIGSTATVITEAVGLTVPALINIPVALAATETSHILPIGTKSFLLQARGKSIIQLSFTALASGTTFVTIPIGATFSTDALNLTSTTTLYFQLSKAGDTVEIVSWS